MMTQPGVHDLGRRTWLAIAGFWTAFGLLESANAYVAELSRGIDRGLVLHLVNNMPWWWSWALITPVAFTLARRIRPGRTRWLGVASKHAAIGIVIALVHMSVVGTLFYYTNGREVPGGLAGQLRSIVANYLAVDVLTYVTVVGAYLVLAAQARARESERRSQMLALQASRLEAQMAEARLRALRSQLDPHFLFNTLNGISGLVRLRENETAVRMIAQLGTLLRETVSGDGAAEVTLERELDLLNRYIDLERMRFHDRLRVTVDVPHDLLDTLVPPLILQPAVENALRHGIGPQPGPGELIVRARTSDSHLVVEVLDTGPGFAGDPEEIAPGLGLSNTRGRLAQLYGETASLALRNRPDGGAAVTLRLPCRSGASSRVLTPLPEPVGV